MRDEWWWIIETVSGLVVLAILLGLWMFHHPGPPERRIWKCIRFHGGGQLVSPRKMSIEEVTQWLAHENNCEIAHIDYECSFIFYKPRGG